MDRSEATARLLCAVDTTDLDQARALAQQLTGHVGALKLGLEFFCAHGPDGISQVTDGKHGLFLDLKLHDIPNTVAGGLRGMAPIRPFLTTIHASGGPAMMRAAMAAAHDLGEARPKVVAVTMLTSMDDDDVEAVGMRGPVSDQVLRLADLVQACEVDGVVCSALETERLRKHCGEDFLLVVPGIRPAWAASDDQKRIMTPGEAMAGGASYLVVGRPITTADDP
ncbi:MAG: orotidine-5'-phosphate decarboxylase, partial [Alphaproteobacteria bacterium]|nr:orotidine-5'-phosphate decarboxylase [Alphaproteobacteria bacterium]